MKIDEIIHPKDKSSRSDDVIGDKPKGSDRLSKEREKRNKDVLQGKDHDPNRDSDMLKKQNEANALSEFKVPGQSGTDVQIFKNPTRTAIINITKRLNSLRGLFENNDFYFWDASAELHKPMAEKLGLEYDYLKRLSLRIKDDVIYLDHTDEQWLALLDNPYIQRTFDIDEQDSIYIAINNNMLKTESLSIDHEVGSQNMSSEQADDFAKLLKAQKFEYFQDAMQYAIKHYEIKRYGGTGMFAMVGKGTNSDYIVRRSKDSEIRTIDNWWKFAKLAMENQNKSSCFPRILVTADLRDKKTGGIQSIGVVEFVNISKNKSTKRSLFDEGFFNWVIAALSHGARNEQDVLKFYARKKKVAPFQAWLEDKKKMGFDLNEFAKFIEVIGNAEYDIHTDNYGVANDGRFVIFDPVK